MKDETKLWLDYAKENLLSAQILLESSFYNTVLQNTQQSIEKDLKALFVEKGIKLQKTHSISSLVEILKQNNIIINISEDDMDLIDSIYLSSKYPFGSVLPDFEPDTLICEICINIAINIKEDVKTYL